MGPAAEYKHVPEIYQRGRKKTSRAQYTMYTTQVENIQGTGILYTRDRKKTSRGPVYFIHETGRRHPGDRINSSIARKKTSRGQD